MFYVLCLFSPIYCLFLFLSETPDEYLSELLKNTVSWVKYHYSHKIMNFIILF